ncbi:unnamed protein product, partial [Porites evermanni]
HGKGNKPQAAQAIDEVEEDALFEAGEFGDSNPGALQRTVWWFLSLHFGFRARDESRKPCISRLLDADVPENFVAQLSGHKSTESLQSYMSASAKHQKRMSLTLSRADVSGSRDEALSSVHNQEFEVVTRSTTDIASSSTTTTLIDQSSDPLLSSTAPIFTGGNIGSISGCTFQIFHGNVKIVQNERKRRIVIDSDEDD